MILLMGFLAEFGLLLFLHSCRENDLFVFLRLLVSRLSLPASPSVGRGQHFFYFAPGLTARQRIQSAERAGRERCKGRLLGRVVLMENGRPRAGRGRPFLLTRGWMTVDSPSRDL